jgi:type VI secretion system secreted protein VgrG
MDFVEDAGLALDFSRFTQQNRLFRLGPTHADTLLLDRFEGTEGLSMPFRFTLRLLSDRADLALQDLMGQELGVFLATGAGERCFSGRVTSFAHTGTDGGFAFYEATLGPWTEFLRHRTNHRIFQGLTLPEVVRALFADHGALARYELRLAEADYPAMAICTQYGESDFAFLSRLLEAHGVYYHFRFDPQGHTLVLADDSRQAPAMPERDRIAYRSGPGAGGQDAIDRWARRHDLAASAYAARTFDFQNPRDRLVSEAGTGQDRGSLPRLEQYEYPGSFAYDGPDEGQRQARLRVQELDLHGQACTGAGTCRFLACGHTFALLDHYGQDGEPRFLVTRVDHEGGNNYRSRPGQPPYRNSFACIPARVPFRPARATPRPVVQGLQTATVVGPPGEEILCDRFGRVRVQFHWDREGAFTEASSCWVRVGSPWAGSRFGLVALPRVGQEVLVACLEGNPDRPIIVGAAYNSLNMPPWELPGNRTQSGILTRSSPGGADANANALRFEDRKGAEEVWLHAERDHRIEVEHDERHQVGQDRSQAIGRDQTTEIKRDRTETVGRDAQLVVGRQLKADAGQGMTLVAHQGGFKAIAARDGMDLQAQNGDLTLAAADNLRIYANQAEMLLLAGKKLTLMCGSSYLTLSADGIELGGPAFTGNAGKVSWPGTQRLEAVLPRLVPGKTEGRFLLHVEGSDQLVRNRPYRITLSDGQVVEGVSDDQGLTELREEDGMKIIDLEIGPAKPLS